MSLDDTDLSHPRRCVELAREGLADGDETRHPEFSAALGWMGLGR